MVAAVLRQALAVLAALAVTALALAAAPPAQAAPGVRAAPKAHAASRARAALTVSAAHEVAARPGLQPGRGLLSGPGLLSGRDPQPLPGEWWFSAWDIQTRVWPLTMGAGVTVGLLDSGVQAILPDLRGAVVPGGDTTGAGTDGMTDDAASDDGHGTAMAALIVGQGTGGGPVGIAPGAKILPVRVGGLHGTSPEGTDATDAAGIRYAAGHGAEVINMSLGGVTSSPSGCDPVLQDAVAYALEHNVVVVASAGNLGTSGNPAMSPASCAGVLSVGAVNPNLTLWRDSEQQPYVAVTAPGNQVGFLGLDGKYFPDGWGTSDAAALVSGAVALVRSRYPSMPWYRVVQRIISTALPEGGTVPNDSFGYGIVRIPRALNASRYPVAADGPNPVYDAYRQWLASPQGQEFSSPAPARPHSRQAHARPAAAPASSGVSGGMVAVIAAAGLIIAVGAVSVVVTARRRRRRT